MDKRDDTEVITLSNGVQILMPAAMPEASAEDLRERITEARSEIEAVIEDDHENEYDMAAVIADRVVAPLLTELRQLGDLYIHACRGASERQKLATLIRDLTDPEPCWFDHHGGCQAHGYLGLEPTERCPHAEAKKVLAAMGIELEA